MPAGYALVRGGVVDRRLDVAELPPAGLARIEAGSLETRRAELRVGKFLQFFGQTLRRPAGIHGAAVALLARGLLVMHKQVAKFGNADNSWVLKQIIDSTGLRFLN